MAAERVRRAKEESDTVVRSDIKRSSLAAATRGVRSKDDAVEPDASGEGRMSADRLAQLT